MRRASVSLMMTTLGALAVSRSLKARPLSSGAGDQQNHAGCAQQSQHYGANFADYFIRQWDGVDARVGVRVGVVARDACADGAQFRVGLRGGCLWSQPRDDVDPMRATIGAALFGRIERRPDFRQVARRVINDPNNPAGESVTVMSSFSLGNSRANWAAMAFSSASACGIVTPGFRRPCAKKVASPRVSSADQPSICACIIVGNQISGR